MFFHDQALPSHKIKDLRLLALLGDAICNLYEKESAFTQFSTANKVHAHAIHRVNAKAQAAFLAQLKEHLTDEELDIVKRAGNLKQSSYRKGDKSVYRQSTSFEALIGFLYVCYPNRLKELFALLNRDRLQTAQSD